MEDRLPSMMTGAEALELIRLLYQPVLILVTALLFHEWVFQSYIRRTAALVLVVRATNALQPNTLYNTAPAYGLGFITAWVIISAANLLLCHDPIKDFKYGGKGAPETTFTRLSWILQLLTSLRGIGWDFGPGHAPRRETKAPTANEAGKLRVAFLKRQLLIIAVEYVLLDFIVYLVLRDPFLSGTELNPFSLTTKERQKWFILLPYRLLIADMGIYTVIDMLSKYTAIICVGVFGEKLVGSWGQYWKYPPVFGSLRSIWDRGLAGFWGEFWHPLFKFGFTSVAKGIVPLPTDTKNRSPFMVSTLRFLRLLMVFTLSGLLHALGSHALASSPRKPTTYPLLTFLTFVLQAPGIAIQQFLFGGFEGISRVGCEGKGFGIGKKVGMLMFTFLWGLGSCVFLVADFASGELFQCPFLPGSVIDGVILLVRRLVG